MATTDDSVSEGGLGGLNSPPGARDVRLAEKAIRERWPIPEERRPQIAEGLAQVAASRKASHRNRIAAARALTAMDALNMEQEKRDRVTQQPSPEGGVHLNVNVTVTVISRSEFDGLPLDEQVRILRTPGRLQITD